MKLNRNLALVLVAGILAVTACKKDNPTPNTPNTPNTPAPPTRTQQLTAKTWKIKQHRMIENGRTDTSNINIVGATNWRLTFAANRTGTAEGTFMATQANPSPAFSWSFNNDSTFVSLAPTAGGNGLDLQLIDSTSLRRVVPNITLAIVNSQGQQTGQISGTLIESFERIP
ncbi:MAG: hypothetical protein Q8J69_10440 [Sphingobacteriaceae bacterium]|nr:hypothetical protein [Sphingobacteriaceae bacterium]